MEFPMTTMGARGSHLASATLVTRNSALKLRGRFTSIDRQRLRDVGLTAEQMDAIQRHALPEIRKALKQPTKNGIVNELYELQIAATTMERVCRRFLYRTVVCGELEAPYAEAENAKAALTELGEAWIESATSTLDEVSGDDFEIVRPGRRTEADSLKKAGSACWELMRLADLALTEVNSWSAQARRSEGDPAPVIAVWEALQRAHRNGSTAVAAPGERGSRFREVVRISYEACGYPRDMTPKAALRKGIAEIKERLTKAAAG
jgi:hypothetical protein